MNDVRGVALSEVRSQGAGLREGVYDPALSLLALARVLGKQRGGIHV